MLEQVAEGLLRNDPEVDGQPRMGHDLGAGGPRWTPCRSPRARRRRPESASSRRRGADHDVEVLDGVGAAARAARELDAQGGQVLAQRMQAPPRPSAPSRAACAPWGARPRRRPAPRRSPPPSGRSPGRPSGCRPRLPASRSSSELTPRWSYRSRTRLIPRPGIRVTSTSPAGIFAFSLSADGIEPVSEQRVDLLGDRPSDAESSSARPCLAISSTETPASRIAFAALR